MICYSKECRVAKVPVTGMECSCWKDCRFFDNEAPVRDSVSHPDYYQGPHECIDLMKALFGEKDVMAFCRCNSFKYRFRAGRKEGADAEEDLAKARWYEDFLIEMRQREGL